MANKGRVLILCTGNSARSQMAEGLLRHAAGNRFEVYSAGTQPKQVRPEAIGVMRERAIDISGHRQKSMDEFAGQTFDYVITVCDDARQSCPIFPGNARYLHWSIEDPASSPGSEEERRTVFRGVRDDLAARIQTFVREH